MTSQQKRIVKELKRLFKSLPTAKGRVKTDKDAGILYITVKMQCPVRKENAVAERWLNEEQCNTLIKMGNPKLDLEMMLELMAIECEKLMNEVLCYE